MWRYEYIESAHDFKYNSDKGGVCDEAHQNTEHPDFEQYHQKRRMW